MMPFSRKKKGSITVYFVLFLLVFMALLGAVMFSVRQRGAKTMVKTAARQSMLDLFSRYEPTLFQEYELLFLDAGFNSSEFHPGRLLTCVENNAGILWGKDSKATNLWGLNKPQAALLSYTLATDQEGELFYRQAVACGQNELFSDAIDALKSRISLGNRQQEVAKKEGDVKTACDTYQQAIEKAQEGNFEKDAGQNAPPDVTAVSQKKSDNPIETIKKLQKKGILGLVMPPHTEISEKKVDKTSLLSNRKQQKGMGIQAVKDPHQMTDHLLFNTYLCEHLGSAVAPDAAAELSWQLEYVYAGKDSDRKNLKKTVESLLLLREGANLLYLKKDAASMAKVRTMATAIAASLAVPITEELIANVLCVCWAYGESLLDVKALLAGEKVPLVKDATSWQLSLAELAHLDPAKQMNRHTQKQGLSYTEYMQILLGTKTDKSCLLRGMDMVELGMRAKEGLADFRLDHCIGSAQIEIRAKLSGGQSITAKEYRSYAD